MSNNLCILPHEVFRTNLQGRCSPHTTDEEIGLEWLNVLLKVTEIENVRALGCYLLLTLSFLVQCQIMIPRWRREMPYSNPFQRQTFSPTVGSAFMWYASAPLPQDLPQLQRSTCLRSYPRQTRRVPYQVSWGFVRPASQHRCCFYPVLLPSQTVTR